MADRKLEIRIVADHERVPTERQFGILLALGSGAALLAGTKRTVEPLVRHGWVTTKRDYAFARITPAGLCALAAGVERYGLPSLSGFEQAVDAGDHVRRLAESVLERRRQGRLAA